jgi:hypothetical protein
MDCFVRQTDHTYHGAPISPKANLNMGAPVAVCTVRVNSNKNIRFGKYVFAFYLKMGIIAVAMSVFHGGNMYEGTNGHPVWNNHN